MNARKKFALTLKFLRKNEGLNQVEMAKILQVSRASISYYENCERIPDIEFLEAVSKYFDVSCDYLLGFSCTPKVGANYKYTGLTESLIFALRNKSTKDIAIEFRKLLNGFDLADLIALLLTQRIEEKGDENNGQGIRHQSRS